MSILIKTSTNFLTERPLVVSGSLPRYCTSDFSYWSIAHRRRTSSEALETHDAITNRHNPRLCRNGIFVSCRAAPSHARFQRALCHCDISSFYEPTGWTVQGMTQFFVRLRNKHNLRIYTLRMPGQRMYIVNSLTLVQSLPHQIKNIAFAPIEAQAAATVMGVGPAGNAIIGSEKMFEGDSYLSTFVPSIHPALSPGPGLDALNNAAIQYISGSLGKINAQTKVELFSWIRHQMFMATTESVYGPNNPFQDPILENAWYDFEPGIMIHMIQAWPSLFARKSLDARERLLIPAFEKYFAAKSHLNNSLLVKCRYNHNLEHGLQGRDVAATEIGQIAASLTNSMASAYWMIYHVFPNPKILKDYRAEVQQLVRVSEDGVSTVDLANVKSSCPVLLSTWQETLRYEHIGISARVVMKDTMLDGKYLLKKGATVMTAAPIQHTEKSLWGSTVNTFDHRRFVKDSTATRVNPAAFRAFGGGTVLCPGRHFVSTEVMAFTALLLLRFDMKPDGGKWLKPKKNYPMTTAIPTPKDKTHVEIVPRNDHR